ncbi:MAG: hypothetical protein AAF184_24865 [Pseudomonadota bacterium]
MRDEGGEVKRLSNALVLISSVAVIGLLIIATILEWHWVWGLLFAYWTGSGLVHGESFLLMPIPRATRPGLFWAASLTWGGLALWFLADAFW